ncbi:MAG TPA: FAD-dependent oxidoreductase, partial [Beutenbergiaceae bacterium]|nr:FAD-dependent oxidoreductase [Beutenbergiaceae bacterium]
EKADVTIMANTEVTGMIVEDGHIRGVRTSKGDVVADTVVIAAGVWSPKIGDMAGAHIPLTPAVHQMISVGPCQVLAEKPGEISFPIVRDMDTFCYERQHGADMQIGSYAHRAILYDPEEIPTIEQARTSPTELPFTDEDFDPQLEQALELMPELLEDERAEMHYAINGLLSLTPDGLPVLGETPEVKGLWSAAAIWVKDGPGMARAIAQWMTQGYSDIDLHHFDIARFHPHQRSRRYVKDRSDEGFIKTYGIVHPSEQWQSARDVRLAPMHASQVELGAVFHETTGWERPHWYESNAGLLEKFGDAVMPRAHEWDARWWSPIVNAEHLQLREAGAMVDLSAFAMFDVVGPAALEAVDRIIVARADQPIGKVIYTPVVDQRGCFRSDLTVMRLDTNHFRVVTGAGHAMNDLKWFNDHMPEGAQCIDVTSAYSTIGLWGQKALDVLSALTNDDVTPGGITFASFKNIQVGMLPVMASRISYVGEFGWELHVPFEAGGALWEMLLEEGKPHGVIPAGIGIYNGSGRIEKGYRAYGSDLDPERTPAEAGMGRKRYKDTDFIGKGVLVSQGNAQQDRVLCTLTVEDHTSASGIKRYMLGGEPILSTDGQPLIDSTGLRSYVTTAGSGPSVGKHVLFAYLPAEYAEIGTELRVSYMEERYPVKVASNDATSLFDPDNNRLRGIYE